MFDAYQLTNNKSSASPDKICKVPINISVNINEDRKSLPLQKPDMRNKPAKNLGQFKARLIQAKRKKVSMKPQKNIQRQARINSLRREISPGSRSTKQPLLSHAYV